MASALAMDKWRTKLVWLASGIPTPRYRVVDARPTGCSVVARARPAADRQARARRLDASASPRCAASITTSCASAYAAGARSTTTWCSSRSSSQGSELTASILGDARAAADPHRGAAGQLRLPEQVFLRRHAVLLPGGHRRRRIEERDPREGAAALSTSSAAAAGAALDLILRADGTLLVPRGEHLARHDRPQPGADGGEARRACRSPTSASTILRGRPCGMTRRQLNAAAR